MRPGNPEAKRTKMDISFNTRTTPVTVPAETPRPNAATAKEAASPALTVTEARVADAGALEAVPDSALRRDDTLGRLFSAAFSLPAPPMPVFPAS